MGEFETSPPSEAQGMLPPRPPFGFHGREAALLRLLQLARDGAEGFARELAVTAPPGAGKTELLRECARQAAADAALLPIFISLPLEPLHGGVRPAGAGVRQEDLVWRAWLVQVLRQCVALRGSAAEQGAIAQGWLDNAALTESGFERLVPWLALLSEPRRELTLSDATALLRELAASRLGAPLLLIESPQLPGQDGQAQQQLLMLRRAAHAARCPLAFEWGGGDAPPAEHLNLELLALEPLELAESGALAAAVGQQRGWVLGPPVLEPILRRLGPWPGWVLGWAAQLGATLRENPVRYGEEAYLHWLTGSGWARMMRQALDHACPASAQRPLLRLLMSLPRRGPLGVHELPGLLGITASDAARLAIELVAAGLLARQGQQVVLAVPTAVQHWLELQAEGEPEGAGWSPQRLALMARLLGAPRPAPEQATFEFDARSTLSRLPVLFRGQRVPEVLFDFPNYHEAVGRLPAADRRETMRRATHNLRLPEMIGLAREASSVNVPVYSARAYQEGKYQRSHEQTWLVADLSRVRVATSPEIKLALEAFRRIERTQGAGRYLRWVIIGEGASAEAIELVKQEKLLSSCREQLAMLQEILEPAAPRTPPQEPETTGPRGKLEAHTLSDAPPPPATPAPRRASPEPAREPAPVMQAVPTAPIVPTRPAPAPETVTRTVGAGVIDMAETQGTNGPLEDSRLSLPARDGSEYIAALMAEKLALRGGFDAGAAGKIKTAVLEGVLNAIEHSPNGEKMIELGFLMDGEGMRIVIENEGTTFDPLAVPPPDPRAKLSATNKRGWGISLMKQFMDEVAYDPCDRGTRLRLYKRREADTGPQKAYGGKFNL